jgi:predicted membrane-bound mannosyltransferase
VLILGLALVGAGAALTRRGIADSSVGLLRFVVVYTTAMTVAYSVLPYKTPWCMLGFLHGMILLAGVGAVALVRSIPLRGSGAVRAAAVAGRVVVGLLLAAGAVQLGLQAYRGSFVYSADNRNPYVYAHTSTNLLRLVGQVKDIAAVHEDRGKMVIRVLTAGGDCWPLPWYLREFDNHQIGYYDHVPDDLTADVIIASPCFAETLEERLGKGYQGEIYGLRPTVFLQTYVANELWEKFLRSRSEVE